MKKRIFMRITASFFMLALFAPVFLPYPASAQIDIGAQHAQNIGLGNTDPKSIIVGVVQVILGFLGLLAVGGIIFGGFMYMTSGGDEAKSGSGMKAVVAGAVGLLIVLAAWGISLWVISNLAAQTGTNVQ
jgi:hypothetical protein